MGERERVGEREKEREKERERKKEKEKEKKEREKCKKQFNQFLKMRLKTIKNDRLWIFENCRVTVGKKKVAFF